MSPSPDVVESPLITAEELAGELGDPSLRVIECTTILDRVAAPPGYIARSGAEAWASGHIAGSRHLDLSSGPFSDPTARVAFTMPSADRLAEAFGAFGVGDGRRVVVYDAGGNRWAARVWWMLRSIGFDDARVLDGGLTAWSAAGLPVTSVPGSAGAEPSGPRGAGADEPAAVWPSATLTPRPRPGVFVGSPEVLAALGDDGSALVSAVSPTQHWGEGYARPGRIPGACNIPAASLVDPQTTRFRPRAELRVVFDDLLDTDRVIAYCGGGIAACADALVLHMLGHENVAIYDGSMAEWTTDPTLPMELPA